MPKMRKDTRRVVQSANGHAMENQAPAHQVGEEAQGMRILRKFRKGVGCRGLGFRVWGLGCRVWGLGFGV